MTDNFLFGFETETEIERFLDFLFDEQWTPKMKHIHDSFLFCHSHLLTQHNPSQVDNQILVENQTIGNGQHLDATSQNCSVKDSFITVTKLKCESQKLQIQ